MHFKLRARHVLPAMVVVAAGSAGLLSSSAAAHTTDTTHRSAADDPVSTADASKSITYRTLPRSYIAPGEALFESTCSSCHGTEALGSAVAPPLQGLGPATVDFWLSTGRMPLANPYKQPIEKPPRFDKKQTLEIAAFVSSLAPISPDYPKGVPSVDTKDANLSVGNSLFVLNCAACHTITGSGDAIAEGSFAPTLHNPTVTEIAEAIRIGPDQMPHFGPGTLSNQQVADIVAYVSHYIEHPNNRGGVGLGEVGPVAEGFVGLLIGVGGLMLIAFWLGDRA